MNLSVKPVVAVKLSSWVTAIVFVLMMSVSGVTHAQEDLLESLNPGSAQSAEEAADSQPPIEVDVAASNDDDIEQRLGSILSEIDAMAGIEVDVSNSVVQLSGEVQNAEARSEAQELAASVAGVVKVDNQIVVSRDVTQRVRSTWDRLSELTQQSIGVLPVLILAVLILVAFWYLAGFAARQQGVWRKLAPNAFIANVVGSIARLLVLLFGILIALYLLDATSIIATVLGAAGIVGLALGFAVRDTVENFIASILLSVRQPFRMNDLVQIDIHQGNVARLTGRATVLISPDGNQIQIPNAVVYKSIITNYTRHPMRRFELTVPVDEGEDLAVARQTAAEAMRHIPGVLSKPSPQIHIQSLGETIISLTIFGWVDQQSHDLLKVQTVSAIKVKSALRSAGIVMPESVHTLKLVDSQKDAGALEQLAGKTDKQNQTKQKAGKEPAATQPVVEAQGDMDTRLELSEQDVISTQLKQEQREPQND